MDKIENIPIELRQIDNWVNWDKTRNDDKAKIPLNPRTGSFAKSNDPSTWGSFEKALDRVKEQGWGLGFMIGDTDYIGIDIDDLTENWQIADEFVDKLNSYVEKSPSGNGVHIWVKGDVELNRYRKDGIEIYNKNSPRYLTITGDIIGDKREISDEVEELIKLHEKYIGNEKNNVINLFNQPVERTVGGLSDDEVIKAIRKSQSKEKFDSLYKGEWESYYKSRSEADLGFMTMLAFWTGKNPKQMDRIFRKSKMFRDKWDEKRGDSTYAEITISKAIDGTDEVYKPAVEETVLQFGSDIVMVSGRQYCVMTKEGVTPISTFIMELQELIVGVDDGEVNYKVKFLGDNYSEVKEFPAVTLNNKTEFMKELQHPSLSFIGELLHLQEIKKILDNQDYKLTKGVKAIGFHEIDNERVFVSQDDVLGEDGKLTDGVTISEFDKAITTNILKSDGIDREGLIELGKDLFKFNSLGVTASILGILPMMFLKYPLYGRGVKTPHLMIYGESGAGKSQTIEKIILPFFGIEGESIISCGNVTPFTLSKTFSSSNAIPIILDEYKPARMTRYILDALSEALRSSYDLHFVTRGRANQTMNRYRLVAPVVMSGEEGQDETAIKERSVVVNLSKLGRRNTGEHFDRLKGNKCLISGLGRSILDMLMGIDIEDVVKRRRELSDKYVRGKISEDRVVTSVSSVVMGLDLVKSVYDSQGLDFRNCVGYSFEELINAVIHNALEEVIEEGGRTKSIVENTIEIISDMVDLGILNGNHYKLLNDNELALRLNMIYPELTKYIRDYNISTEILQSRSQFAKQLRGTEYCIEYNRTVRYSLGTAKSYILSPQLLIDNGLSVEGLLRQVEE